MVQFCYLRPYLGIETFSIVCCYGWQGWKWMRDSGHLKMFSNPMLVKDTKKNYDQCSLIKFV